MKTRAMQQTYPRPATILALSVLALTLASCGSRHPKHPPPPPPPPPAPPESGTVPMSRTAPEILLAVPEVRASSLFIGDGQHPLKEFAAYGILAFRSEATSQSENRYMAICEGFLATLPAALELVDQGVPLKDQMATAWPISNPDLANSLNDTNADETPQSRCAEIVAGIDLITSIDAIQKATRASDDENLRGRGPYLLAWSPSTNFGQANVPVLVMDLSSVTTSEQAKERFRAWADDIQRNPALWRSGWNLERLRVTLRLWADRFGPGILFVFSLISG